MELVAEFLCVNTSFIRQCSVHSALLGMVADRTATAGTFILGASLSEFTTVMTGQCKGSTSGSLEFPCVGSLVVVLAVIPQIVMSILLCWMGADVVVQVIGIVYLNILAILVILVQLDIHLRHEGVPVHAVAVEDCLIDFLLVIP